MSTRGSLSLRVASAIAFGSVGCVSVVCVRAQQWVALEPVAETQWNGAFDPRRGRFVHLAADATTWERIGDEAIAVPTGVPPFGAPVARTGFATTYDAARGRVLLFGGQVLSPMADSWSWDGIAWVRQAAAVAPPRRANAAMAYDAGRDAVVLYGGADFAVIGDAWEFRQGQWTQLPRPTQTPVSYPQMAYHAPQGRILLVADQTYTWDGTTWSPVAAAPAIGPGLRLAHDHVRGRTVC